MARHVYDPADDGLDTASFDAGWESGIRDVLQWIRQFRPRIPDVATDIEAIFLGDKT